MKFWMFHLMPWPHLPSDFDEKYDTAWVTCPNPLFDPQQGPEVYHQYINQLAYADQLGFDGVVINEHHQNAYGIMPSANLIAAALSQRVQKARVMVLGSGLPHLGLERNSNKKYVRKSINQCAAISCQLAEEVLRGQSLAVRQKSWNGDSLSKAER